VRWSAEFHDEFVPEYEALDEAVQDELLAHIEVLETFGPQLGRPRVDTLKGSRHANMKELRFDASDGVWRFASPLIRGGRLSSSLRRRQVRRKREALLSAADSEG
jgi:hypothetical protein